MESKFSKIQMTTVRTCTSCQSTEPPPKRCGACKKAWYCSPACQKHDWVRHIFECNPSREITTADHLALAVRQGVTPEHVDTVSDYGFLSTVSRRDTIMLFGVYVGLLDVLGVKPLILHKWRKEGTLVENIEKEFDQIPEDLRGDYYLWFTKNQHVFSSGLTLQSHLKRQSNLEEDSRQAWCFIGRPPEASTNDIQRWTSSLPSEDRDCFTLYTLLLSGPYPSPVRPMWIHFGFCACPDEGAEKKLARSYKRLIRACSFKEFCIAYRSSSLASLFLRTGEDEYSNPYLLDVLSRSPHEHNPVWDLKQYICNWSSVDIAYASVAPPPPPRWGFPPSQNAVDRQTLVELYKKFFDLGENANPLELNKARLEDCLFQFFTEELSLYLKPTKTYKRLLSLRAPRTARRAYQMSDTTEHQCSSCHRPAPPKQCSACKVAWYCDADCQKKDWVRHIFDCSSSKPITTANYLALAVKEQRLRDDPQTCRDYGFGKVDILTASKEVLGLYTVLLDPDRLGSSAERGEHYAWFIRHQDVFAKPKDTQRTAERTDDLFRRVWTFIGRSPTTPIEEIHRWRRSLPEDGQDCFLFYTTLLLDAPPSAAFESWIRFGFCGCQNERAERELLGQYHELVRKTTFNDFCTAYSSSTLLQLFRSKSIVISDRFVGTILASPNFRNSVWDLKQYIKGKSTPGVDTSHLQPVPSVMVDYGFINCQRESEHKLLFNVYKRFFDMESADPFQLHGACLEGRLFHYFTEDLGMTLDPFKVLCAHPAGEYRPYPNSLNPCFSPVDRSCWLQMPRISERQCNFCHHAEPPPKQCVACKKAWYCSVDCQKIDWVRHIFDCNPTRPINTADHLALACSKFTIPEHPQTCADYGFSFVDRDTAIPLLGLYAGLLHPHRIGVKPYTLHKWRVNGQLVENIKKTFDALPEKARGSCYTWFLENQDVLDGRRTQEQREDQMKVEIMAHFKRAWALMGRDPSTHPNKILEWREALSDKDDNCFQLYSLLLSDCRPSTSFHELWVSFGFCGCADDAAERQLVECYLELMRKTTFDDFCNAYASTSLVTLFREKGVNIGNPFVVDVLSSPLKEIKSVWKLRLYTEIKKARGLEDESGPAPDVCEDYDFDNCEDPEEEKLLFELYKGFFDMRTKVNPFDLHHACTKGRLFSYFTRDLGLKLRLKKTYQRLLENSHTPSDG
ncbi:hypothetical protein NP233_g5010 [Leucocoprinus birnbaumii]|uniref:MYND-type domain-containing protein n=1 Tax=Leucocoprinus birnbaumii TaxID=56174 RepID=A0AAD5VVZ1_9AGAR|nr:hypothetical protein NP233_g5010 [Leucocoprinus birnbaumii]